VWNAATRELRARVAARPQLEDAATHPNDQPCRAEQRLGYAWSAGWRPVIAGSAFRRLTQRRHRARWGERRQGVTRAQHQLARRLQVLEATHLALYQGHITHACIVAPTGELMYGDKVSDAQIFGLHSNLGQCCRTVLSFAAASRQAAHHDDRQQRCRLIRLRPAPGSGAAEYDRTAVAI